jgi:transposase
MKPLKMKSPKRIDIDHLQANALRQRVATRSLEESDYLIIEGMIETVIFLSQVLEEKNVSIKRLRQLVFGAGTESAKNVLGKTTQDTQKDAQGGTEGKSQETPDSRVDEAGVDEHGGENEQKNKCKGHGRNGAHAYTGAEKVLVSHETLKSGDRCPSCLKGRVYRTKIPRVIVRVTGTAPLSARVWELESLRCNLCGEVFTAQAPQGVGEEKYDETCGAMIALLKYGSGFPFYRLEGLQNSLGIPLPASTQWEIVEQVADKIYPAYEELIRQAAQGEVLHNDDTTVKILALMKAIPDQQSADEGAGKNDPPRSGVFTSGIVSVREGRKIAVFFSGRKHAGENLEDLLQKRQLGLGPPIQMCDALSRNLPKKLKTIVAHCLSHARRKFVDVISYFPDECRYLIEALAKVYHHDDRAKEENMSADERLKFHQEKSGPVMERLKVWLVEQIEGKKVEPNSSLGDAISYMLKYWDRFTLFLRVPNAPLDNNICEQILKRSILHRKNSLFFKTELGAYIGDMFMSLIHTCYLNKVNPFDYLVALQKYPQHLSKNPHLWMPWNYKDTISSLKTPSPQSLDNSDLKPPD